MGFEHWPNLKLLPSFTSQWRIDSRQHLRPIVDKHLKFISLQANRFFRDKGTALDTNTYHRWLHPINLTHTRFHNHYHHPNNLSIRQPVLWHHHHNATTGKQRCRECCTHYSTSRSSATASADHYSNAFNYWSPGHLNRRHGPDVPTPTPGFGVSTSSTSPTSTSGHPQSTHSTTSTTTHCTNCTSCLYTTTSHSKGYFHYIHSSWPSSHITSQISKYHTSSPQIHPQITHKIS